jgi:Rne/Rng family ribonuclease
MAFDDGIEAAIAALADTVADLPGGARMSVHPTPALVAIDVDLGSASARRDGKANAQRGANQVLLPELCRQIRLRNLSGAILVDLAGMAVRKRASLAPAFAAALAGDPLAPRFLGFTALGLAEILRPRIHPPLHELLAVPHAAGLAALRAIWREEAANPSRRMALRTVPAIAAAIRGDGVALSALAQRSGRDLIVIEDRSLAAPGWILEEANRG